MKPGIRKRQKEAESYIGDRYSAYEDILLGDSSHSENLDELAQIDEDYVRRLIVDGLYLNKCEHETNYYPLWFALIRYLEVIHNKSKNELLDWMTFLQDHGVDYHKKDSQGFWSIDRAAKEHSFTLFTMLIEDFKVPVNISPRCHITGFIPYTPEENVDIERVKNLLSMGLPSQSALFNAVAYRQVEITKLLLADGADPNFKDHTGVTPFMWAFGNPASGGNWTPSATNAIEIAKLLLAAGADPKIKSNQRRTPRSILNKSEHYPKELVELLDEFGG